MYLVKTFSPFPSHAVTHRPQQRLSHNLQNPYCSVVTVTFLTSSTPESMERGRSDSSKDGFTNYTLNCTDGGTSDAEHAVEHPFSHEKLYD